MNRHTDLVRGLRDLADFIEARPHMHIGFSPLVLNIFPDTLDEVIALQAGKLEKANNGTFFYLRKRFGGMVSIEWNKPRETVCKRVVVGTRETVKPIMEKVGEEIVAEEIVEWQCPESLLDPSERVTKLKVDSAPMTDPIPF